MSETEKFLIIINLFFSLSVGYVDNMGRFFTEIEPDPHRKYEKESRLSRAVRRLVNMDQDKVRIFIGNISK